jgi:hypothetical protein
MSFYGGFPTTESTKVHRIWEIILWNEHKQGEKETKFFGKDLKLKKLLLSLLFIKTIYKKGDLK